MFGTEEKTSLSLYRFIFLSLVFMDSKIDAQIQKENRSLDYLLELTFDPLGLSCFSLPPLFSVSPWAICGPCGDFLMVLLFFSFENLFRFQILTYLYLFLFSYPELLIPTDLFIAFYVIFSFLFIFFLGQARHVVPLHE